MEGLTHVYGGPLSVSAFFLFMFSILVVLVKRLVSTPRFFVPHLGNKNLQNEKSYDTMNRGAAVSIFSTISA